MSDSRPAPVRGPVSLAIEPAVAEQLAYYRAEQGPGVLAPRGWKCYTQDGSSGIGVRVQPDLPEPGSKAWASAIRGPYVGKSFSFADTSGRFNVARLIARFFPQHADFVRKVIAEDVEPASNFPEGPWPDDRVAYRSPAVAEFTTPPGKRGMGSEWLGVSDATIRGLIQLCDDGVYVTTVRLPAELEHLSSAVIEPVQPDPDSCILKVG